MLWSNISWAVSVCPLSLLAPFPQFIAPHHRPSVRPTTDPPLSPSFVRCPKQSRRGLRCNGEESERERDDYLSGHKDSPSESRSGEEGRKSAAKAERGNLIPESHSMMS